MKDDPEFNIKFVSLVETFSCLYDNTSADYNRRDVVNNAWEEIAKEIAESVQDCKERWKNLRACYSRHLKLINETPFGSEAKIKKPYYLAEYLHFLQPYTKTRKSKGIYNAPQAVISSPEEILVTDIETNDSEDEVRFSHSEQEALNQESFKLSQVDHFRTQNVLKKNYKSYRKTDVSLADVNTSALDYFLSKISRNEKKDENPDLEFFKSILPDMSEMSNDQKRRFKIGILNLAGQIINEKKKSVSCEAST